MQLNAFCYKDIWALSTYTSNNLVREKPLSICAPNKNYSIPSSEKRQELTFSFKMKSLSLFTTFIMGI